MTSKMHIGQDIAHTRILVFSSRKKRRSTRGKKEGGRKKESKPFGSRLSRKIRATGRVLSYCRKRRAILEAYARTVRACARVCAHRKSQCVGKHALVTWPVFIWWEPPKDASRELIRNKSRRLGFLSGPSLSLLPWAVKAVKKRRAASHEAFVILMRVYLQATKRPGPCIISYVGHPGSERIAFLAEMYFSLPLSSKTDGARLRVARLMAILIVASFCPGNFGILILETRIEKCVSFLLYRMRQIGSIKSPRGLWLLNCREVLSGKFWNFNSWDSDFFFRNSFLRFFIDQELMSI